MQEPKAGKRIVSKGAYAANVGKTAASSLAGLSLALFGCVGLLLTCMMLWDLTSTAYAGSRILLGLSALMVAGFSLLLLYAGRRLMRKALQVEIGVPVSRANTADLPAPDSLVRASQEPAQAQEGVLLRAASGEAQAGQEGHAEQLLRAATSD